MYNKCENLAEHHETDLPTRDIEKPYRVFLEGTRAGM